MHILFDAKKHEQFLGIPLAATGVDLRFRIFQDTTVERTKYLKYGWGREDM